MKVVRVLNGVVIGLLLANAWSYVALSASSAWAMSLDVNNEKNFATGFSVLLLLSCAWLLWRVSRRLMKGDRFINHWRSLSLIFIGMACDEWFLVHERLNELLDNHFYTTGLFYYDWVIPGSLFVLGVVLIYLRFLQALPSKTRNHFLIAGGLYVSGALGMEMVSGYYIYHHGLGNRDVLSVLRGLEESMEMFGLIAFVYGLLVYLQSLDRQAHKRQAAQMVSQKRSYYSTKE